MINDMLLSQWTTDLLDQALTILGEADKAILLLFLRSPRIIPRSRVQLLGYSTLDEYHVGLRMVLDKLRDHFRSQGITSSFDLSLDDQVNMPSLANITIPQPDQSRPSRLTYRCGGARFEITYPNGEVETTHNLSGWAREHGMSVRQLRPLYKRMERVTRTGYRVRRLTDQYSAMAASA